MKENRAAQPLSRVPRPRLYEQLVKQLLDYIEAEQLGPGDLLPAERDLAERLGVSRATLVQALVALEVLGAIDVQHGTGAVLVHRPRIATVIKSLREHRNRLPEIVEARSTLEVKLAGLAAIRRTDADLDAIDSALEVMAIDVEGGGRGLQGDELFHQAPSNSADGGRLLGVGSVSEISETGRETRRAVRRLCGGASTTNPVANGWTTRATTTVLPVPPPMSQSSGVSEASKWSGSVGI